MLNARGHQFKLLALFAFLIGIGPCYAMEAEALKIEWRVHNPFPFIRDPVQLGALRDGLKDITASGNFDKYAKAVESAYANTAWNTAKQEFDRALLHSPNVSIQARVVGAGALGCSWNGVSSGRCSDWIKLEMPRKDGLRVAAKLEDGRLVDATISVKRRIILGVGDSFSSGEGNPDKPAQWDESKLDARDVRGSYRMWATTAPETATTAAGWNDVPCHRSLYSWQFLHALGSVQDDTQEETVFVSLACSGAEIFDGLLVQQFDRDLRPKAPGAQLSEAVKLLCKSEPTALKPQTFFHGIQNRDVEVKLVQCAKEDLLTPDRVLLTIGGNDVGFGGLIAWTTFPGNGWTLLGSFVVREINKELTPKTGLVCPKKNSWGDKRCAEVFAAVDEFDTNRRLHTNLKQVHHFIGSLLSTHASNVYQINYPWSLNDEAGKLCLYNRSSRASIAMKNELFINLKKKNSLLKLGYDNYSVGPHPDKVVDVKKLVVDPLINTINDLAKQDVQIVETAQAFEKNGYCARGRSSDMDMPTQHGQAKGIWWPSKPSEINHYASVARWFRTPNDAQLVMHRDTRYGLSAWTGGVFHPNHLGHLAMFMQLEHRMRAKSVSALPTGVSN